MDLLMKEVNVISVCYKSHDNELISLIKLILQSWAPTTTTSSPSLKSNPYSATLQGKTWTEKCPVGPEKKNQNNQTLTTTIPTSTHREATISKPASTWTKHPYPLKGYRALTKTTTEYIIKIQILKSPIKMAMAKLLKLILGDKCHPKTILEDKSREESILMGNILNNNTVMSKILINYNFALIDNTLRGLKEVLY